MATLPYHNRRNGFFHVNIVNLFSYLITNMNETGSHPPIDVNQCQADRGAR